MRVKLPDNLAERVEGVVDSKGYNGVTDFTREAIRVRLEDIESTDKFPED